MNKLILSLLLFLSFSTTIFAQSFEGIIEMYQVTSNGLEYDLKWYIKNDKIAYEISPRTTRGDGGQMRFVPQKSSNTMIIVTGDTKTKIAASDITAPEGFSMEGAKIQDKGTVTNPNFKEVKTLEISTNDIISTVELTTDINIKFSDYAAFFKADYGLCALAESKKTGFPLNSVTKDKKGNVLTQTTLKKVTRTVVADSYFQ